MLFLMRRCQASTFAMPRWPRLARTRSPSRGRRSPPRLICRASSGRTGGPPMHGEAPPAWRLATSRWPALARARLSADLDVGQRRPVELLSTSAGPPCIIGPHRRPSDARRVWPRRPARAGPAVQCQPCRACKTTAMTSSGRTGGPPMPQLLRHRCRRQRGNVAVTSPGIFGPHRRPSDTKRGPRRASPPAALRLRPPAVSTSSSLRLLTGTVPPEELDLPDHIGVWGSVGHPSANGLFSIVSSGGWPLVRRILSSPVCVPVTAFHYPVGLNKYAGHPFDGSGPSLSPAKRESVCRRPLRPLLIGELFRG